MKKKLANDRSIEVEIPEGRILVYYIYGKIGEKPIGSAVISVYSNHTVVLHIYVEKPYRRQGYARDLIEEMKERHNYIITGWQGSESCGRDLFLACGFEVKKAMFKNRHSTLEWKRGK